MRKSPLENLKTESSLDQMRFALDNVPAFVFMKDLDFRYTYANRRTLELFGCLEADLVGSSDSRFFPPDTVKTLREIDLRVFNGESTEEEVTSDDGDYRRIFSEMKTPIYSDDKRDIVGLLGISIDITERKNTEDRARNSEEALTMSEAVANSGHWRWFF